MTETSAASANFEGLEVVAFESRRAPEMAALITRFGGVPRVAPALREAPLEENAAALAFGAALFAGRLDAVIFMTGVGTRRLIRGAGNAPRPRQDCASAGGNYRGGARAQAGQGPARTPGARHHHRARAQHLARSPARAGRKSARIHAGGQPRGGAGIWRAQ